MKFDPIATCLTKASTKQDPTMTHHTYFDLTSKTKPKIEIWECPLSHQWVPDLKEGLRSKGQRQHSKNKSNKKTRTKWTTKTYLQASSWVKAGNRVRVQGRQEPALVPKPKQVIKRKKKRKKKEIAAEAERREREKKKIDKEWNKEIWELNRG